MISFPNNPSLHKLQQYQQAICAARGWDKTSDLEAFLLFTEEVGELAKAIRNRRKLYQEEGKPVPAHQLEDEFADVFSYLLELANRFDIDLATAYKNKEEKNHGRDWSSKT